MSGSVSIRTEWHSADGITAPELAATFCRLEIWLGEQCLTRVEDRRGGGVRDGIYCSAYSLAEWLATHWWALRQDVRYAERSTRSSSALLNSESLPVDERHDLRAASDGFIWPACTIAPEGRCTLVSWRARPSRPDEPIAYLSSGAVYVDTNELSRVLARFIETVIERLEAQGASAPLLGEEWRAIAEADDDEAAFCNAAAALGLDPYDVDPRMAKLLERLGTSLGDAVTVELAQAADPALLEEDFRWVKDAESRLRERSPSSAALEPLRDAMSIVPAESTRAPYRIGWEHARQARKVLGWNYAQPADIEGLVHVERQPAKDPTLLGAAIVRRDDLAVIVGARSAASRVAVAGRFVAGRALWRGLHTKSDQPFLITNATTWSHRVERAFAAEILAPVEGIEEIIGRPRVVDPETMYELAHHYEVAPTLIRHQLENQLDTTVAC